MGSVTCILYQPYLGENRQVEVPAWRDVGQQRRTGSGEGTLSVELRCQVVPVLETDLKDLRLLHLRHQQHEVQGLGTGKA